MSDRDAEAFAYYEDAARREPAPGPPRRRADTPLTRHVPVRFPASTIEEVKRLADLDGMTVSAWIRHAVNRALQERTDVFHRASQRVQTKVLHQMTDLDRALALAVRLDEAVREAVTSEVLTVDAVEMGSVVVGVPGPSRLIEDLWLARRSFAALHFLMLNTARSTTPAGDLTESAALLGRRLFELLGQVSWLTDYEPPDGLALPVPIGDAIELAEAAAGVPWPEEDRALYCAYLASARTWMDIQALRADRKDLIQRRRLAEAIIDVGDTEERRKGLAIIQAQDDLVERRLSYVGAPTDPRYDMVSLLRRINAQAILAYRYESDVAHGGTVGRLHQRGASGQPMLGAPAPDERRLMVVRTANAVMLAIAQRVLQARGGDAGPLEVIAKEHLASLDAG